MTKPAAIRQADVRRAIQGALAAGLKAEEITIEIVGGTIRILPIAANTPSDDAADMERRMREAFGQ